MKKEPLKLDNVSCLPKCRIKDRRVGVGLSHSCNVDCTTGESFICCSTYYGLGPHQPLARRPHKAAPAGKCGSEKGPLSQFQTENSITQLAEV